MLKNVFFLALLFVAASTALSSPASSLVSASSSHFNSHTVKSNPFITWFNEHVSNFAKPEPLADSLNDSSDFESHGVAENLNAVPKFIRFAHITDIHYDPLYVANASAESLCHVETENAKSDTYPYGQRGSECDSPLLLVSEVFKSLKTNLRSQLGSSELGFILWSGDSARHDRDDKNPRNASELLHQNEKVVSLFTNHVNVSSTLVIPSIGNWDVYPSNDFGVDDINGDKLKKLFEVWKPLFTNSDGVVDSKIRVTFEQGGYFARVVVPGKLAVISINTLSYFNLNEAIGDCAPIPGNFDVPDSNHPGDVQNRWIVDYLRKSRLTGMKIMIVGHVPPVTNSGPNYYPECLQSWASISGEFSDVILSQYFGHINRDTVSFVVAPKLKTTVGILSKQYGIKSFDANKVRAIDLNKWRLVGAIYTSPSIIPVYNPAIKVGFIQFPLNGNVFTSDHLQLALNLDGVNGASQIDGSPFNDGKLPFKKTCSARDSFGLYKVNVESWTTFLKTVQFSAGNTNDSSNTSSGILRRYRNCEVVGTEHRVDLPINVDILGYILLGVVAAAVGFILWLFSIKQKEWKRIEEGMVRIPTRPQQRHLERQPLVDNASKFDEDETWNSLSIANQSASNSAPTTRKRAGTLQSLEQWPIIVQQQQRYEKYKALNESKKTERVNRHSRTGSDLAIVGDLPSEAGGSSSYQYRYSTFSRSSAKLNGGYSPKRDGSLIPVSPQMWDDPNFLKVPLSPAMPKHSSRLEETLFKLDTEN
ncbi:Endopolyphosphatase [Nowakowskiella sp. JEL0407]|nr:Endopolyphosphatase [Nowakowskiella sp. JEL0407]